MAKYIKIRCAPENYANYEDIARYTFIEVDDAFDPDNNDADQDQLWVEVDSAVSEYVESRFEIIDGDPEEDEDY